MGLLGIKDMVGL